MAIQVHRIAWRVLFAAKSLPRRFPNSSFFPSSRHSGKLTCEVLGVGVIPSPRLDTRIQAPVAHVLAERRVSDPDERPCSVSRLPCAARCCVCATPSECATPDGSARLRASWLEHAVVIAARQ